MKRIFIALLFALTCAPDAVQSRPVLPDSPESTGAFRLNGGEDRPPRERSSRRTESAEGDRPPRERAPRERKSEVGDDAPPPRR